VTATPSSPKALSLAFEVDELERAIDGARVLLDEYRLGSITDAADEEHVPRHVSAILGIVAARMRLVRSAVRGGLNPKLVWSPFNAQPGPPQAGDDPDVTLTGWNPRERVAHAMRERRLAEYDLGPVRPRRKRKGRQVR
jgi:hypothetical protein